MSAKQDPEKLLFLLEMKYFSYSTLYSDHEILEMGLQEMMQKDAKQPKRPYRAQKVIKKSKNTCVVCCFMGEMALADKKNNEALKAFTNALRVAPAFSNIAAHCYYYRSIALKNLTAYPESLKDIERALDLPISGEQKANLENRKNVIQKLLLKRNSYNSTKINILDEEVTLSYGESTEIKGVSNAIALVYSARFGRHFLSTRNIKVGDVLMIQKPYVIVLSKEGDDSPKGKEWFCENCFKTTKAPIPCDYCAMLFYCSIECKFEAYDKFHKTECKLANLSPPLGPISTLFLRTLLIMTKQGENFQGTLNLMNDVKKRKDRRTAGFKNGKLDGSNGEAILSLLHHMDKQNITTIVAHAAQVAVALKKHTDFFKGSNDVRGLANLMIFLSYICFRNFYCLRRKAWDNVTALTMNSVMNLLNHSCACNTLSYNDKYGNIILRACKNTAKGEQIFVSYNTFEIMYLTAKERQNALKMSKFFICECEACVRDYTYALELRGAFKVPKELKYRLQNKPNDTEGLWKLLKLLLQEYPHPCAEAKKIEMAIVNAYLGSDNENLYSTLEELNFF